MAYTQQPRYGAPQRPQFEHQQASYASSHQAYAAEYDYEGVDKGGSSDGPSGRGAPMQYPDAYGQRGGAHGIDRDRRPGQEDFPHQNGNQYGGGGQRSGGRPIVQNPLPSARGADSQAYSDPRSRDPPQSRSRPLPKGQYHQQDPDHQARQRLEPQPYKQHHPPQQDPYIGAPGQANGGYEYEDPSYGPQNNWHSNQHYGHPDTRNHDYHDPQQGFDQPQGYSDGFGTRSLPGGHANAQITPMPKYDDVAAPLSINGQSHDSSTRSESWHRSKPKKILENPIPPETLSWDNPFPTFPTRPKKGVHGVSNSLDGSVADPNNSRPQTANSKESSYTFTEDEQPVQAIRHPTNQHAGYFEQIPPTTEIAEQRRDVASRSHENGRSGRRVEQLKPPIANGRHSEDNRARPFMPVDLTVTSPYERSRTMPTAVSEAAVNPGYQPRQADQTSWQEPGPVAGYYGPEDREYLPLSPVEPPQQRLHDQSMARSDERRPFDHASTEAPISNFRQPHAPFDSPHDSLGEFFDDYYTGAPQDQQRPLPKQGQLYRTSVDEDMPNFGAVPGPASAHRRGMTIDDHLQPQEKTQAYPPPPAPPQHNGRRDPRNGPTPNGQYLPRSRSQPNLKDRRSPRAQQDNGFDFGVPSALDRPPATAPIWGGNSAGPHSPMGFPNVNPQTRGPRPQDRQYSGLVSPAGYASNDRNRAANPPPRAGPSPGAYQDRGPPDRYRSPPLQGGRPPPGQMKLPGGGPSPVDRNMANDVRSMGYRGGTPTDRYRSPPIQQGRSPQALIGPPGGRPSPSYPTGPTQPPNKALSNPDALPSHPAPFRPGLNGSASSGQAPKPAPIRQYDAAPSPGQSSGSSQPANEKRESGSITHQELERVKQDAANKPGSLSTQLTLAKKLVEASTVLVDERGDPRNRSKAREKYIVDAHRIVKKLSSNGYPEAIFYLADAYSRGSLGLESDTREAFKLYQTAAKQNHAQAAYRVAVCCEIGQEEGGGTSRDPVKAMQWYKRAATLGDTPAMYKMGIISLKGLLGQPKNPREALVWLKRAAERADRENPHALHEMALLHEKPNSNDGVAQDEAYSKQLFTQAANLGYKFSQFRMGCAYEYGLMGCPVDPRQSIAWYSKAAVQEEHQSELALSGWYLTGSEGVLQQSDTEAYLWARKAAQAGLAKAEYAMGYFTEVGIGAPANLDDAKRWYWRSASQNFPKARDRLEELRKGGATKQKTRVSRSNMKKQSDGECIVM